MAERKSEAVWIEKRQLWRINIQKDGERKSFYSTMLDKKGKIEAEKKADKWMDDKTKNINIRFGKAWEGFLAKTKLETGTSNYIKLEQIGRLYLLPTLQHKKVADITLQDWQNCIDFGYKKGLYKKSLQNIRGAITAFYRYAKKNRIFMERPEDITIKKDAPVKDKTILQPDDINKLFSADYITKYNKQEPSFFIHAWRFILLTGLRRGELCGIENQDVKENVLFIKRSINRENEVTKGKNDNANRYVALCGLALLELEEQAKMLKKYGIISPYVFPDEYGQRLNPNHLYRKWVTYREQHGIKSSIHEMRHTMVSVSKS